MGGFLLPWEKLPPYVLGPLLSIGAICVLVFARGLSWWEIVLDGCAGALGAWGTWVWFSNGQNIFDLSGQKTKEKQRNDH
jgi:hypothetical protein